MEKEPTFWKCKTCNEPVTNLMGCIAHGNSHGNRVNKNNFKEFYSLIKKPTPEMIAKYEKGKSYRIKAKGENHKKTKSPKNQIDLTHYPKLVQILGVELVEGDGIVLTAKISVTEQFLSSVIIQNLT